MHPAAFPLWLTTKHGRITALLLALGGVFGVLILQYYFPFSSVTGSMWSVLGTILALSFVTASYLPYRTRNPLIAITGIINTLCCFISFVAFCIGTTFRTSDTTTMGIALFVCMIMTVVSVFWTLLPMFPISIAADQQQHDEEETQAKTIPAITTDRTTLTAPTPPANSTDRCSSTPCTICLTIAWMLFCVIVILYTHDAVGYDTDYANTSPLSNQWILQQHITPITAMEDPDYPTDDTLNARYVHMFCNGTGKPLVLLEHGRGGTLWDWAWVQGIVAGNTRVCSWSRPGYGFSSRGHEARTAGRIAEELHKLLETENITEPFIHVGHSFGGLVLRAYQARYPQTVLAQVFVDAMNADCFEPCAKGVIWPLGVGHILATLIPTGFGRAMSETNNLPLDGTGLLAMLPPDVRDARRASFISLPFWEAYAEEEDNFPTSCYVARTRGGRNMTQLPVVSIIAEFGIHQVNATDTDLVCGHELATSVGGANARSLVVKGAGHIELVFDRQYAVQVAQVVLEVIDQVRNA